MNISDVFSHIRRVFVCVFAYSPSIRRVFSHMRSRIPAYSRVFAAYSRVFPRIPAYSPRIHRVFARVFVRVFSRIRRVFSHILAYFSRILAYFSRIRVWTLLYESCLSLQFQCPSRICILNSPSNSEVRPLEMSSLQCNRLWLQNRTRSLNSKCHGGVNASWWADAHLFIFEKLRNERIKLPHVLGVFCVHCILKSNSAS